MDGYIRIQGVKTLAVTNMLKQWIKNIADIFVIL